MNENLQSISLQVNIEKKERIEMMVKSLAVAAVAAVVAVLARVAHHLMIHLRQLKLRNRFIPNKEEVGVDLMMPCNSDRNFYIRTNTG